MYAQGHLAILRGNLAPEGCVAKITGLKNPVDHRARARVRLRERGDGRDHGAQDQGRRRRRDPLRRTEGRAGHAGDARADLRADRPGPRRIGRPHHRRPLLRRHLGHGRRPRRARGVRRRHRSRWSRKATRSRSTRTSSSSSSTSTTRSSRARRAAWKPPKPRYTRGLAGASTCASCRRPARARSPTASRDAVPARCLRSPRSLRAHGARP